MELNHYKTSFFLIILITIFLRLTFLGSLPRGLSSQEATIGLRSQNLVNYHKDEYGRELPFFFYNRFDVELPIQSYLTALFVALNQTSVVLLRLPSAISGILVVIGSVKLVQTLFPKRQSLPLWAGLVLAISPWAIWQSRIASPTQLFLCLTIWGVFLLFQGKRKSIFFGTGLLTLALLTDKLALLFIPFLSLTFFLKVPRKIAFPISVILFSVSLGLFISNKFVLQGFIDNQFTLLSDHSYLNNLNNMRGDVNNFGQTALSKIYYNKLQLLVLILNNFLASLNPSYLFARGDGNSLHQPSNFGPLLLFTTIFLGVGIKKLVNESILIKKFLLLWLLIGVLPSLLLAKSPDTLVLITIFIPLSIVTALGLEGLNKRLAVISIFLLILNLSIVINDLLTKEPQRAVGAWQTSTVMIAENKLFQNKRVWLTDSLDSNPGPVISYLNKIPYSQLNLDKDNPYKGWVSQSANWTIGGSTKPGKKTPQNIFDVYILDQKQYQELIQEDMAADYVIEKLEDYYLLK